MRSLLPHSVHRRRGGKTDLLGCPIQRNAICIQRHGHVIPHRLQILIRCMTRNRTEFADEIFLIEAGKSSQGFDVQLFHVMLVDISDGKMNVLVFRSCFPTVLFFDFRYQQT